MKKLIVFGATGGTGLEIVKQALNLGFYVTVFIRDIITFELAHPSLRIMTGNVFDLQSVKEAIRDQEVVISALGNGTKLKPTKVYSEGMHNIILAMKQYDVKRIICISAGGIEVNSKNNFMIRLLTKWVLQKILKEPYKDMRLMEKMVKRSFLDYTIVRPPRLVNVPLTKIYRIQLNEELPGTTKISRADLAHFIVQNIYNENTFRSFVNISY